MAQARVENRTLAEQVYQYIRTEILNERFAPGSELSEVAIAEQLGISRGPVREAMGRLRAEGLVEVRPRRGAVVASLTRKEFLEAYQVRIALEVSAIRFGVENSTPEALVAIEDLMEALEERAKAEDEDGFFELNRKLHRAFCELAGNDTLLNIYDRLIARMVRYSHRSAKLRGDLVSSTAEHKAILKAVKAGDADGAARLMEEHISIPLRRVTELNDSEWEGLARI